VVGEGEAVTPAEEDAALRALDTDLTRCHPDLARAFDQWRPPVGQVRARLRRLRALGSQICVVLLLLCVVSVCLYLARIWAGM
jgi:hypothetical protein